MCSFTRTSPALKHFSPSPPEKTYRYSVMQSDRNSFCGDVVLDSVNMAPRDKDSISTKYMKSKHVRNSFFNDFSTFGMKCCLYS